MVFLCVTFSLRLEWRFSKALCLCPFGCNQIPEAYIRPMLDRIDIHIEVPRVDYEKLSSDRLGESSALIRERVQAARERQRVALKGWILSAIQIWAWRKCVSSVS